MTARVCPVHGEYSETGVCRWCEPETPLPEGHTRCRCGWMAWTEYAPRPFREEHKGVVHSPEQCYATAATPPAEPVSLPGLKGLWQKPDSVEVNEAGVPTYTFILTEKTEDEYRWRLEWTQAVVDFDANAIQESILADQHAALRWERVARRWAAKGTAAEHRMTVEGELAFDDHCGECLRAGRRVLSPDPRRSSLPVVVTRKIDLTEGILR